MNKRSWLNLFLVAVLFQLLTLFWLSGQRFGQNWKNLAGKFSLAVFVSDNEAVEVVAERIRRLPTVGEAQVVTAKDILEKVRSQPALAGLYLPEDNPFQPYVAVRLRDFTVPDRDLLFKNIPGVNLVKYDQELYLLIQDFRQQRNSWEKQFWLIGILLLLGVIGRFIFLPVSGSDLFNLIYRLIIVLIILLSNYLIFRQLIYSFSQFLIIFVFGLLSCLLI